MLARDNSHCPKNNLEYKLFCFVPSILGVAALMALYFAPIVLVQDSGLPNEQIRELIACFRVLFGGSALIAFGTTAYMLRH